MVVIQINITMIGVVKAGYRDFSRISPERSTWILRRSTSAKYEISDLKSSRSQLFKTSKIIKIHPIAFENELSKDGNKNMEFQKFRCDLYRKI